MLSVIGKFLGIEIVNLVRSAIMAAALTSSSLLVGYVKGRIDGAAIATANAAWLAEDLNKTDNAQADADEAANREAVKDAVSVEVHNDAIEMLLAQPNPADGSCNVASGGWLQDLGKLR